MTPEDRDLQKQLNKIALIEGARERHAKRVERLKANPELTKALREQIEREYRPPYAAVWCAVAAAVFWVVGLLWVGFLIWRAL